MFWFYTRIGGNEIPKRTLPDDEDLDFKFPPLVRRQARASPKKAEADNVKLPGLGRKKKDDDASRGRGALTWSASDASRRLAPGAYGGAPAEAAYRPTSRERLSPVLGIPSPVGSPTFETRQMVRAGKGGAMAVVRMRVGPCRTEPTFLGGERGRGDSLRRHRLSAWPCRAPTSLTPCTRPPSSLCALNSICACPPHHLLLCPLLFLLLLVALFPSLPPLSRPCSRRSSLLVIRHS